MNYLGSNPVKIITRTANLYNKATLRTSGSDFANCREVKTYDDGNVLIARGKEDATTAKFNYNNGWVRPGHQYVNGLKKNTFSLNAGEEVTISADFTLIEKGTSTAEVRCYLGVGSGAVTPTNEKEITETPKRLSWKFTAKSDCINCFPIFPINSNKVRIENIAIKLGEDATYEPYNQLWRVRSGALIRNPKNLIPFPYPTASKSENGVEFVAQSDGGVRIKGTCTKNTFYTIYRDCTLFSSYWNTTLNGSPTIRDGYCASAKASNLPETSKAYMAYEFYGSSNSNRGHIYLMTRAGETYDCVVYPILNEGDTAEPFYVQD